MLKTGNIKSKKTRLKCPNLAIGLKEKDKKSKSQNQSGPKTTSRPETRSAHKNLQK